MGSSSLNTFIKDVRGAKTLAEERAIITKASAKIRTKLRDDHLPLHKRRKNIQKLLYLYILGEKTHFGQVECINLIASEDFADKRLGYLAASLLLDESQDLLTLLTNLLNNDLNHPNKYVVSLALTTLGSLGSSELARDLYIDVENILKASRDPFIIKKALQCIGKLITKDFTLLDIFDTKFITNLLNNRPLCTHGVLLGINKVLQSLLLNYDQFHKSLENDGHSDESNLLPTFVTLIPELLSILGNLCTRNVEPEFDIQGTCDPFLQCEIIYTLRLAFQYPLEHSQYKNKFSDLLTQIATNTDGSKNCGQAILYEAARTIFSLNLEQSLRVLGVNILAKFLSQKDNNIKYVALNTLLKVVDQEPATVQRHRKFISKCLRDPDISIRKRALELTFAVLDGVNLVETVNELVDFLERATDDDKDLIIYTVENLVKNLEKHSVKDVKWKLITLFESLKLAGVYITPGITTDILVAINNTKDTFQRCDITADMLRFSLDDSKNHELSDDNLAWIIVITWCIGEYGDEILESLTDHSIINEMTLTRYLVSQDTKFSIVDKRLINYVLTAALKFSAKIKDSGSIESLRQIILNHTKDSDLLIQSKSVQYEVIFSQPPTVKKVLLESMPHFERKNKVVVEPSSNATPTQYEESTNALIDLGTGNEEVHVPGAAVDLPPVDLLADLFSSTGLSDTVSTKTRNIETLEIPQGAKKIHGDDVLEAYSYLSSCENGVAQIELFLKANHNVTEIKSFSAVPKTQKLVLGQLYPSNNLNQGEVCKQTLKITGTGKLKLRIKLDYMSNDTYVEKQFDHKFDRTL